MPIVDSDALIRDVIDGVAEEPRVEQARVAVRFRQPTEVIHGADAVGASLDERPGRHSCVRERRATCPASKRGATPCADPAPSGAGSGASEKRGVAPLLLATQVATQIATQRATRAVVSHATRVRLN